MHQSTGSFRSWLCQPLSACWSHLFIIWLILFCKSAWYQCFWRHRHRIFCHGDYTGTVLHGRYGKRQLYCPFHRCRKAAACRTGSFCCIFTGLIIGLLIAVLGNLSLRNVVFFLGATETIAPFAQDYARYIFPAAPFMVTSFYYE